VRVVGYVRVSTTDQADEGVSLDAQEAKIRKYAELYELDLVAVERDAGVSGKTLERPGLKAALARISSGESNGLLICKLDRLTRSVADLGVLVDEFFTDHELLSVSDNIDTRSASGRLVLNVLVSVAQWEREIISERTKEALAYLKRNGKRLGAEPFDNQEVIELIRDARESGESYRAICQTLIDRAIPTKRGGTWSPKVVRAILMRQECAV